MALAALSVFMGGGGGGGAKGKREWRDDQASFHTVLIRGRGGGGGGWRRKKSVYTVFINKNRSCQHHPRKDNWYPHTKHHLFIPSRIWSPGCLHWSELGTPAVCWYIFTIFVFCIYSHEFKQRCGLCENQHILSSPVLCPPPPPYPPLP